VLSFLLFPVERPEFFDAVVTDAGGRVLEIQVKRTGADSSWVWGAFKMPGRVLHDLHRLWCEREQADEYMGTLVNAYLVEGGEALGIRSGEAYVDVGTLHGYREAIKVLNAMQQSNIRRSTAHQKVLQEFSCTTKRTEKTDDTEAQLETSR
jgi:NDP-sugar pyrophosphorylase family protein